MESPVYRGAPDSRREPLSRPAPTLLPRPLDANQAGLNGARARRASARRLQQHAGERRIRGPLQGRPRTMIRGTRSHKADDLRRAQGHAAPGPRLLLSADKQHLCLRPPPDNRGANMPRTRSVGPANYRGVTDRVTVCAGATAIPRAACQGVRERCLMED